MQPQNYQPVNDPFAFLNQQPKRRPVTNLVINGSKKQRLIVVAGGVIVLLIAVLIIKWLLGLGSGVNMTSLYNVLGQQEEIANLANIDISNSSVTSQSYLNFSYTALASVATDQSRLLGLLNASGIKTNGKNFLLQSSADNQLNVALQNSSFESVYEPVMHQQLDLYANDIANAYNITGSNLLKSYLKTDYQDTLLLIKMLGASSP